MSPSARWVSRTYSPSIRHNWELRLTIAGMAFSTRQRSKRLPLISRSEFGGGARMASRATLEQLISAVGMALAALSEDLLPARVSVLLVELGLDDAVDLSGDPHFQQQLVGGVRALKELFPKL